MLRDEYGVHANFSDRIWKDKDKLQRNLQDILTQGLVRGDSIHKMAKDMAERMNVSRSNAARLIATESAYFASKGELDNMKELGVKEYEFVATLDSRTSDICKSMDGKVIPLKDFKPGTTAPPLHCYCRSCTVPHVGTVENFQKMRAARDPKTGKTVRIPDMTYQDWHDVFVAKKRTLEEWEREQKRKVAVVAGANTAIPVSDKKYEENYSEEESIHPNGVENAFTINYSMINSKAYHDQFEGITPKAALDEALYKKSREFLSHRNGTPYEDIAMLDARTGNLLVENTSASGVNMFKSGLTREESEYLRKSGKTFEILHNHPRSSLPSVADIVGLFKRRLAVASTVVGHNGRVYRMEKIKDYPKDIEELAQFMYSKAKEKYERDFVDYHASLNLLGYLVSKKYLRYIVR